MGAAGRRDGHIGGRRLLLACVVASVMAGGASCGPAPSPGTAPAVDAARRGRALEDGSPCTPSGTPCASGFCSSEGVCCATACDGQCEACDLPGSVGTCTAVIGAPRPGHPACASDGTACGGSCDGLERTRCTYPQTLCRDPSCSGTTATLAALCDGAGRCPPPETQPCAPFACGATTCAGSCAADSECAAGNFCAGGVCQPTRPNGAACGAPGQCASGQCVDGFCCDTACNGQCEACDTPDRLGTCTPVAGAPHGGRTPCTTDGSVCGGACDAVTTATCGYPRSLCRAASCTAGVATLAAACDGAGHCPGGDTVTCAPSLCGANGACQGNCATDADCAATGYCAGGNCAPRGANGTACSAANQCASGQCADGFCCDSACNGQCQACDVAGRAGTCSPVSGVPHGARPACGGDTSSCRGVCDGRNVVFCVFPGTDVSCRSALCSGGAQVSAASCDGRGACPAPQLRFCGDYACGQDACRAACAQDSDCAPGAACISGQCLTLDKMRARGSGCSSGGGSGLALLLALLALARAVRRRVTAQALLILVLAFAPAAAQAQAAAGTSIAVERFQPGPGQRDVLAIESPLVAPDTAWNARLFLSYADRPLRLLSPAEDVQVLLLRQQTSLHLTAAIDFLDRFEVGVALPVFLSQSSDSTALVAPILSADWSSASLGDLRVIPKARLGALGPVAFGLAVPVTFPTGRARSFLGQDGVTAEPRALAEWDLPTGTRLLGQAGVAFRERRSLADLTVGTAFTYGAGAEQPFPLFGQRFAAQANLVGEAGLQASGTAETPLEALGALRWDTPIGVNVTVGGGAGLTQGYGTPRYRLLFALGYSSERPARAAPAAQPPPPAPNPPPPPPPPPPPAAAPAPPAPAPATVDERKKRIVPPTPIYFGFDSARILRQSYPGLDAIVEALRQHPEITTLRVEGHSDSTGPVAYNRRLSSRRAEAVRRYLVAHGADPKLVVAQGFGPARPVASNETRPGRARNRRVEFVIVAEEPGRR